MIASYQKSGGINLQKASDYIYNTVAKPLEAYRQTVCGEGLTEHHLQDFQKDLFKYP